MSGLNGVRRDLRSFIRSDEAIRRSMAVLGAAASLTDDLAVYLLEASGRGQEESRRLVSALHLCDFVVERNSEWHLEADSRRYLNSQLMGNEELFTQSHRLLLQVAEGGSARSQVDEIPSYLLEGAGGAYHATFIDSDAGLPRYTLWALAPRSGHQWLAAQLAREQKSMGFTGDSIEVDFLEGMLAYREGRPYVAEPLLRRVASVDQTRAEVAISSHVIGRIDSRRPRHRQRAEGLLMRSLEMLRELGDRYGEAQVLHSVGRLLSQWRGRAAEAERYLDESLAIVRELEQPSGEAMVLHSLGRLLSGQTPRRGEAEGALRGSLTLWTEIGGAFERASVEHSLGRLLTQLRGRESEAEDLLRDSLRTFRQRGDRFSEAGVLHSLGQLLVKDPDRFGDAEELLQKSLQLGRRLQKPNHIAQVLYTLGHRLYRGVDDERATAALEESLAVNESQQNWAMATQVRKALESLAQ